ncbi:MAG: DUF4242 domain-containing protein [Proteobacteria bacterium]|nr:MAG: DUF4242 domain-containing protein [Pseudomonadota bacterium]QKK11322.1 MAG: DUF4242 domain-containing protein [Pseudomonadota bacterium]
MSVYMVERDLPGISMEQLGAAQRSAIQTAERFTQAGRSVRYLHSTFVPKEHRCMCLFEANRSEDVAAVNQEANIPYQRIVEALDLRP